MMIEMKLIPLPNATIQYIHIFLRGPKHSAPVFQCTIRYGWFTLTVENLE